MRLSTSTNFFSNKRNGEFTSYVESIRRCKTAGFNVLDVNFAQTLNGRTDLAEDNWEELIFNLRDEAEVLDIEFSQSHPVFMPGNRDRHTPEIHETFREMMRRSIIASSILGVRWAVLHPIEDRALNGFDTKANIKTNFEYYASTVELAKKYNVGIVFENMLETINLKRRFTSDAGELAALIDAYNDPEVGACWDFGHGNMIYKDQCIALRTLGKRLKATHVADNYGLKDEHMFPFHGTIDWATIMPVLIEIGYEGDFTFETHMEFVKLPEHIKDSLAKVAHEIGQYCLSLAVDR